MSTRLNVFVSVLVLFAVQVWVEPALSAPNIITFDAARAGNGCGTCMPPDTHGAVGATQFVQVVNDQLYIYGKTPQLGATAPQLLKSMSLASFFGYFTQKLFDPRVVYDNGAKRWLITADAEPEPTGIQYQFIAASKLSDATGNYFIYKITVNPSGSNNFWDFPQLGVTPSAVLITASIFDSLDNFISSSLLSINKSSLYKGTLSFKRFDSIPFSSLAPPIVIDTNTTAYLVAAPYGSSNALKLYNLASAGTSDIFSGPVDIPVAPYNLASGASQPGTSAFLDTGDTRFANASTQIGSNLWQVHTVAGGNLSLYSRARFYRINTSTNTVVQTGDVSKSTTSFDFNASIAANSTNKVFVTWTATDQNTQAQVRSTTKDDQETSISSGYSVFTSPTFYNPSGPPIGNTVIERWGDYSATTIDPSDNIQAWGVNQKSESVSEWGSRIFNNPVLYITDSVNHRVQTFSKSGIFISQFGSMGSGPGQFQNPYGIAVDETKVYVADSSNNRIQIFNRAGTFLSQFGSAGAGPGQFDGPFGITFDATQLYITDWANHRVQIFNKGGIFVSEFGSFGENPGQFINPAAISVDDTKIYIGENYTDRIQIFTKTGVFLSQFSNTNGSRCRSDALTIGNGIWGMVLDSTQLYTSSVTDYCIRTYTKDGLFISQFGSGPGLSAGQFTGPAGIFVDGQKIFVVDSGNNRMQIFNKAGSFIFQFGSFGSRQGQFSDPVGIASDRE